MGNVEEFKKLFNILEAELRKSAPKNHWQPFYELVENAAKNNDIVKNYSSTLKEYANLRNLIVHSNSNKYMAEPFTETIEFLGRVIELIKNPPKLDPFLCNVLTFRSDDDLRDVMLSMKENDYSQVPIYNGEKFVGLLTSDTIFRWVASELVVHGKLSEFATVSDALIYDEGVAGCAYIGRDHPLIEIMDLFDGSQFEDCKIISAVLITKNGNQDEEILGIITRSNIPSIHKRVHIDE